MPTVMKKRPSSRPLNGSMSTSIWCRYSLDANSRPARKAPRAEDNPAADVAAAEAMATRSPIATTISLLRVEAASVSSGPSTNRPMTTMPATAATATPMPRTTAIGTDSSESPARIVTRMTPGTTIRSCISSTPKVVRPTSLPRRFCCTSNCRAIAVEENARPSPSTTAAVLSMPCHATATPISTVDNSTCVMPAPRTILRIAHRRPIDSSSPTVKSRKRTPRSANGATRSSLAKVT